MDYYEFMEKANFQLTEEEYAEVEFVYLNAPSEVVGGYVTEFCEWFNKNGKMKAIRLLYPVVVELYDTVLSLNRVREDLEAKNNTCETQARIIQGYETLFSEEEVKQRALEHLSPTNLLTAVARRG